MNISKKLKEKRRKWFGPNFAEIMDEIKEEMMKTNKQLFSLYIKGYKKQGYSEKEAKRLALRDVKLVNVSGAIKSGIPVSKKAIKDLDKW
jgi:hypothetical protein